MQAASRPTLDLTKGDSTAAALPQGHRTRFKPTDPPDGGQTLTDTGLMIRHPSGSPAKPQDAGVVRK